MHKELKDFRVNRARKFSLLRLGESKDIRNAVKLSQTSSF